MDEELYFIDTSNADPAITAWFGPAPSSRLDRWR